MYVVFKRGFIAAMKKMKTKRTDVKDGVFLAGTVQNHCQAWVAGSWTENAAFFSFQHYDKCLTTGDEDGHSFKSKW